MFIAVDMLGTNLKLNISALALLRRIMIAFANNSLNNENNSWQWKCDISALLFLSVYYKQKQIFFY